jgi:hypothetical protein
MILHNVVSLHLPEQVLPISAQQISQEHVQFSHLSAISFFMANNQNILNFCAAIRSNLARQAQDLAAIRADCYAAAAGLGPGVAAPRDYMASLVGNGKVGAWIDWGLLGVGAVQAKSACLIFMMWTLNKSCRWILVALLVNLVLSLLDGLCWLAYLVATGVSRWLMEGR